MARSRVYIPSSFNMDHPCTHIVPAPAKLASSWREPEVSWEGLPMPIACLVAHSSTNTRYISHAVELRRISVPSAKAPRGRSYRRTVARIFGLETREKTARVRRFALSNKLTFSLHSQVPGLHRRLGRYGGLSGAWRYVPAPSAIFPSMRTDGGDLLGTSAMGCRPRSRADSGSEFCLRRRDTVI